MANAVVIVVESLTLSNGSNPVRISQIANKIIPKLLPAKVFVTAISFSFKGLNVAGKELSPAARQSLRQTRKQPAR